MIHHRPWFIGILSVVVSTILMVAATAFASRIPPLDPEVRKGIDKVADLLEKNDTAAAEKLVGELSKNPSARHAMKHAYQRYPDLTATGLTAQARAERVREYKRSGYNIVVIAMLLRTRGPESDQKKQAEWANFALELRQSGRQLITAADKSDPAALKQAAAKVSEACTSCHNQFAPKGLR